MDELLTPIYVTFHMIKDYLHANNQMSIIYIKKYGLRGWVGLKYIFQIAIAIFTGDFKLY